MNLFTKQKQTHRSRNEIYGYQREMWGEVINQDVGINTYTLLYIKQMTNKDLLYNTGNYTQYSVITYMGKNLKKNGYMYIYINLCITDSLCCTPENNTTL